jgi:hypothetical protein
VAGGGDLRDNTGKGRLSLGREAGIMDRRK